MKPSKVSQEPVDLCFSSTDDIFTGDRSYHHQLCPRNRTFGRKLHFGEVQCVTMGLHLPLRFTKWHLGQLQGVWIDHSIELFNKWVKVSVSAFDGELL